MKDRKKVEQLEKFKKTIEQAAHDIITPLQTLSMALNHCFKTLTEEERMLLKKLTNSIKKIAQELLDSNKREVSVDQQDILVSKALAEIIEQKKLTYYGKNVKFQYLFDQSIRFTFIRGNSLNFERMMCNLIKNSVEALEGKKGIIKVGFSVESDNVKITIDDEGKGMSQEIANKLMLGELVSTTKKNGHGIGTQQIRDALTEFHGSQLIESTINVGTKITLTIPKSENPKLAMVPEDGSEEDAHDASSADIVILDDSRSLIEVIIDFLKSRGIKKVDSYYRPDDLLNNISRYSVNTKIFMDNDFKSDISGEDLARELAAQGFKNIYILSGSPTKYLRSKYPEGTKFMEKGSASFIDDLVYYAKML